MAKKKPPIYVLPLWMKKKLDNDGVPELTDAVIISTVSGFGSFVELSPFILGPCELYDNYIAERMENAWQYSKVYKEHLHKSGRYKGEVKRDYWEWAMSGWVNHEAVRYPMGKGAVPEFSLWEDKKLGYIDARKTIYGPLYAEAVQKTKAYERVVNYYNEGKPLVLLDYDAYDHRKENMTLTDVLNRPDKKMGHAFVLAMLLSRDKALKQLALRS